MFMHEDVRYPRNENKGMLSMPSKPTIKPENIFIVKSDELKVMMRKYHDAFPNAFDSYFDSLIDAKKKVDLAEIKKKLTDYFGLTKIDFKLDDYNVYDGVKKTPEFHLPYELADIYCVMAYTICNYNNLLSDGKRTVTPDSALEDIFNFHVYNEEVLKGIDILPTQIRGFIKRQPEYKDQSKLIKYLYEISDRFIVLLSAVAHSERSMGILINKLDDFINDFISHTGKSVLTRKPKAPIYFDKLLTDVFKDVGQYSLLRKNADNTHEKETYEECLFAAWRRYNEQLEQKRARSIETYSEEELNAPIFSALETRKTLLERRLRYDPYEFLEFLLIELKEKGIILKGYYISAQGERGLEMPLRMKIEVLLNLAYKNIDKYKDLYKDEFICQTDKDEIAEHIKIFDELNKLKEKNKISPAKMKERENYKYKKFFREIYLASLGFGRKGIPKNDSFTKEHLLEVKWLFPYCYKFFASNNDDVRDSIIKELENEVERRTLSTEHVEYAVDAAHKIYCGYKGLVKFSLFLFVLFDFMTRIRKGEPKSNLFLPIIESPVEEKIRAIGLSDDERTGLYDYRTTMNYFERKLDWKNILSDENYLIFHELKEGTVRSGPFKAHYSHVKKGADRIIENIARFDGDDFADYLSLLSGDIEHETTAFIEDIYIEGELAKARKYYEHKNRSLFVEGKVRSIMGGLFRDIAMKESRVGRRCYHRFPPSEPCGYLSAYTAQAYFHPIINYYPQGVVL